MCALLDALECPLTDGLYVIILFLLPQEFTETLTLSYWEKPNQLLEGVSAL